MLYNILWCVVVNCPYCGGRNSRVIDSREINDGIRRRRQCQKCNSRFTTYERLQQTGLFIIKKDQRREAFNKDKLLLGIRKACEKRPLPAGIIDKLVDDIEIELYRQGKTEIASTVIGDRVMEKLRDLDYIAYIRFASVYRDFTDIADLKQEIDTLVNSGIEEPRPVSQLPLIPAEELEKVVRPRQGRQK